VIVFTENIQKLLLSSLNSTEKLILSEITFDATVTQFAHNFSKEKNIPLSTVWHNLRKLRDKGFITFSPFSGTKLMDVLV
jgi:hypothetical protein